MRAVQNKGLLSFLLFIISITYSTKCFAQVSTQRSRLFFDRITTENGLSDNKINCLFRDRRGFLWIGTDNGLNEYDGRKVIQLHHNRYDPQSIVSNEILSITEDDSGFLWIGTRDGISKLNPYDNECLNFYHNPDSSFSLKNNYNYYVFIDRENTIWVGNKSGLSYYDEKNERFIRVKLFPDSLNKMPYTMVNCLMEDHLGRLWVGTYSGLYQYDRKQQTFHRYVLKGNSNLVTTLFEDHAGRIWVGIWGQGLSEFDPGKGRFVTTYKWNLKSNYTSTVNIVFALSETLTKTGHYTLWAGTSEGLLKIDTIPFTTSKIIHIHPDPINPHSLSSTEVSSLIADSQKILWIGTNAGLDQYLPGNQTFSNMVDVKGFINNIRIDNYKKQIHYFLATWYGNGFQILDQNFRTVHEWKRVPPGALNVDNSQISDVLRTRDGTIWIGTFNGLYSYDELSGKFTSHLHSDVNPNSPSGDKITSLVEDDDGLLWIGTYGYGVNVFDPIKKTFFHFRHRKDNPNSLCNDLARTVFKDRFKHIWIATNHGLSLYDKPGNQFINYGEGEDEAALLRGDKVTGVIAISDSIIWVSTEKGLTRLNIKNNQSSFFAEEEGIRNSKITGMIRDKNGLLWLCTASGLSSFNPKTRTFINYGEQNGLPNGLNGAFAMDSTGKIIAAGNNFFLLFNPSTIPPPVPPPPVYFTDIRAGGRKIIFTKPVSRSGPLVLHYPVNNFSTSFDAPEFINNSAIKYSYRLDGIDDHWINAGDRNFVSYASLPPGNYTLHIRVSNSKGVWKESSSPLHITVLPPFWKTWWFRSLFFLFISLLAYTFFIYRIRTIRRTEQMKTSLNKQMADIRLQALRSRMNPHFMFNSLNSIQECIYTGKNEAAYKYLSKFSKLVRMILEKSEKTFITIREEIEILELYLQLESLRFGESFNYSITTGGLETDFIRIPAMIVQPFVENAVWHGLLHKPGEKKLKISYQPDMENIRVTIEDNGIGRDAARAHKIKTIIEQKSLGMKLVLDQAGSIENLTGKPLNIKIEDLFSDDDDGNQRTPSGTRVTIILPEINNME